MPPCPLSLSFRLTCCDVEAKFLEAALQVQKVHLNSSCLRDRELARECPLHPWLREHGPPPSPHPQLLPVRQLQLVRAQEAGAHTGLFVFGGNPAAPMALLKGPLSQHQLVPLGARPGWKLGTLESLATLPSGHAGPT